jgi:thiamine phosphate synthase YjbQ (UPF0047 family)
MHNFDFIAHQQLSNAKSNVQMAIESANAKSQQGHFVVCVTHAGEVLVISEFSARVREDIADTVYDTEKGYIFSSNKGDE